LNRLSLLRSKIQQKRLDGYLVTSRIDQFYLTGFDGEDGAALILPRLVYLLTDGRFQEEAATRAGWARAVIRTGGLTPAVAQTIKRHRLERIGFDPAEMSVSLHRSIQKAIRPARLVALEQTTARQRLIKDNGEIATIERAIRAAEDAFTAVTRRIKPGMTERRVAADLQHEMIRRGASSASFPIIVAEGPNASLPHAVPGDRKITESSVLLIDWGATVDHYHSDLTRVVFIRRIPPRFRRMYASVLAAQAAAIGAVRAGVRACDVDAAARQYLKQAGMDRQFTHGTGHGLGLQIHEGPRLGRRATDKLEAGMVVTVEPGVYFPGIGGVRIEDDVLVTADGCRVLSSLSSKMDDWVI